MKPLLLSIAMLAVCVFASAASAGSWIPGTPYLVSEDDANSYLERGFDHAYCNGIPRFGHQGEFPYEEFRVFDCDVTVNGAFCTVREKVTKGTSRGYYRMTIIAHRNCY